MSNISLELICLSCYEYFE